MFKNYFKITLRNIVKHKTYSVINISGLAIGLACTILILLWINDELSYDQFHENGSNLYRIMIAEQYSDGKVEVTKSTSALLAPALTEEIPEITESARFLWEDEILFAVGEKKIKQKGRYADASLFNMFSFPITKGNPDNILPDIHSIAISESMAKKYFDVENPIGATIRLKDVKYEETFTVTGVFEDIPRNSSLRFDFVISLENYLARHQWALRWGTQQFRTFIQLNPSASPDEINNKIKHFLAKHYDNTQDELFLQSYQNIHLYSNFHKGVKPGGRIEYVRLFSVVALFILLIACVNFMILSTAKSFTRTREIGIRKVVGSHQSMLVAQFIGETAITTIIASIIAIIMVELVLPWFNQLTLKSIDIPYTNPFFVLTLLGLIIFTSVFAGGYPAFFLTSFKPVAVLKGESASKARGSGIRHGLIVIQFVLSIVLIVGAIVINRQIIFIKNNNLEMDRENLVHFPVFHGIDKHRKAFMLELKQSPGIKNVTFTNTDPFDVGHSTTDPTWDGKAPSDNIKFNIIKTDFNLLQTLNMELKEGRNFSPEMTTEKSNFIINEEAARLMQMKSPVGQKLSFWGNKNGTIIGVIKDYHFHSLHEANEPMIIMIEPGNCLLGYIRSEAGQITQAIASLKKIYKKYEPDYPLEYAFVDQEYEQMYGSEITTGILANYFALLAIFISCLGLYGLSAFSIERRTKEIGIRKVSGASLANIIALISRDFTIWIVLANLIAWPIAWYATERWLQNFAYRINLTIWPFLLAGLTAMGIALITVSWQTVRAATANPVKSLKYE